jgi:hypothetical protein
MVAWDSDGGEAAEVEPGQLEQALRADEATQYYTQLLSQARLVQAVTKGRPPGKNATRPTAAKDRAAGHAAAQQALATVTQARRCGWCQQVVNHNQRTCPLKRGGQPQAPPPVQERPAVRRQPGRPRQRKRVVEIEAESEAEIEAESVVESVVESEVESVVESEAEGAAGAAAAQAARDIDGEAQEG